VTISDFETAFKEVSPHSKKIKITTEQSTVIVTIQVSFLYWLLYGRHFAKWLVNKFTQYMMISVTLKVRINFLNPDLWTK
jgi:hypothetical protein